MKSRARRSPIWLLPSNQLLELLNKSNTFTEVLAFFGLRNVGSNFKTLTDRLKAEDIDYEKFKRNKHRGSIEGRKQKGYEDKDVFIINSTLSRNGIKRRILKNKYIEYICCECKLLPVWNNKKLSLVLDHINGIANDNRIENLRFLCPNCNSQTDTFAGKNKKYIIQSNIPSNKCIDCSQSITRTSIRCVKCERKLHRKVERPNKEELAKMVWEKPIEQIAIEYGITGNSIRKWCKSYNISKPGPGYWQKKKYST